MEYRDLYDEDRNLIGKTIKKGDLVPDNSYIIVVITYIENSKGEFLIQYTSKEKGNVFSSTGGHAKTGETSLDAVVTEVKEEIGISIPKEEFKLFHSGKDKNKIYDIYYLYKDINIDTLTVQKEEVDYVKWMTINEIKDLINKGLFQKTHATMFEKLMINYNEMER